VTARLKFNHLVLTAPGRVYVVDFFDGVNVISGPIYTGKSSILQLLDYACGAKQCPTYPQIQKCSDVLVECQAGEEVVTIRRSLKSETSKAFLYEGPVEDVLTGSIEPEEVSARHIPAGPSVSSELLKRLRLANIDVKTAPTRESSETSSFSIRDLLLLLYVDQDRMGSKKAGFFEDNQFKLNKWHAGFEIVHGLFDREATALSEALNEAEIDRNRVQQFLNNARRFLTQSKIPETHVLEETLASLKAEKLRMTVTLTSVQKNVRAQMGDSFRLVTRRDELDEAADTCFARARELQRTLQQLGRLRVQYGREEAQIEFLGESESLVSRLPVIRCPGCLQAIESEPDVASCHVCHRGLPRHDGEISVEARLRATRRKISDLESYIEEIESDVAKLGARRASLLEDKEGIDRSLIRLRQITLLPDTKEVMEISEALSAVSQRIEQTEQQLYLRHRAQGEGSNLLAIEDRVKSLRDELDAASKRRKSPEEVVHSLSTLFVDTLKQIEFPELSDSWIDPDQFIPFVRKQPYRSLSSKGAISLAMTAWHIAVLRHALTNDSRFPRLLMLDSPLNHVGHKSDDDQFKDQQIVEAFYGLFAKLHADFASDFQIILVDNAPPAQADTLSNIAFTRDPRRGRFGLIDDEHPPVNSESA
jgi:hypothetical protein